MKQVETTKGGLNFRCKRSEIRETMSKFRQVELAAADSRSVWPPIAPLILVALLETVAPVLGQTLKAVPLFM